MKYVVATFLLCLQLAAASEDAAAETTCPATDLSVTTSPSKYYCKDTPSYTVGGPAATASGVSSSNGKVTVTFTNNLILSALTQCGAAATAPVTCDSLALTFGSAEDQNDGSAIVLGATKFDGLAHWSCEDAASPTSSEFNYYFFMQVGTENSDTNADGTITQVNNALTPGGSVTAANLDPNVFQKFTGVDDKTQIYFFKQSDTASHTVFYSDNTLIKFSATQFNSVLNGITGHTGPTAAKVCKHGVLFCSDEGCDKSGAAVLLSGTMMMLIPIIFTQF